MYARLPRVQRDESRTRGPDRLELIKFLRVARTITVHHGALPYLLGINALRASQAAAVRIEDYAQSLRGHRVLRLVGKGNKPATMPITVPVLRVLEACRGERASGPLVLLPGGVIEVGESERGALARELHEELGVQIATGSASHLCRVTAGPAEAPALLSAWLVRDWQGTPANVAPEEHDDIGWFGLQELPPPAHAVVRTALVDAMRSHGA